MEGTVLHFNETEKKGVLRDNDGNRYEFVADEWGSVMKPKSGLLVDFVAKDNVATQIYTLSSVGISEISNNISEKIVNFQDSDIGKKISEKIVNLQVTDIGKKVAALFTNGIHNKFGMLATIAVLVSLFFPIIKVPFLGMASIFNFEAGKYLFTILIILSIFFYGGATKLYIKILTGIVLGILFFLYYDLFSGLNQANDLFSGMDQSKHLFTNDYSRSEKQNSPNFFSLVSWGAYVNVAACVALFMVSFVKKYINNEEAI
jgi:hypothetical protein